MQRPPPGSVPDTPGSYQFKDAAGRVLYVGKAKSLRQRLASYFQSPDALAPRTAQMVAAAASVEWIEVRNEVEALLLEHSLIQTHQPRFNVRFRDDKSYPYLAVTLDDEWPRAMVLRGRKRKGVRYFGPYTHAYAIRETLDLLLRTFPVRTCSDAKLRRHERQGRPCLLYHIEKCSAPCVGEIDRRSYDELVQELLQFLEGETDPVLRRLERDMAEAAERLEFEQAARLRDRLASVRKVIERQQMVVQRDEDLDVIGTAEDELEAAVQLFHVRRGRVVGRKGFVVDKVTELAGSELVARVLEEVYAEPPPMGVPRTVLVPELPEELPLYERFLATQRGSKVAVKVPQRGDKRQLMETVAHNAAEELQRHRLRRASDHNSRAQALRELQEHLGLPAAPLRIECFDMSHLQGSDYVGSMVVFEDGLPRKAEYRRFKVRDVPGNDDYAAMEEVLRRRLRSYLREREKPAAEQGRFAYPPQLLVVDGGRGQLDVAVRVVEELGLRDDVPLAALAKRFEEVFLPTAARPLVLPRGSEALYLLQRVRDEAHRFAVSYHRQLRGKRMTRSAVDGVAGLGPARRERLQRELGGVRAVQQASLDELLALSWLPDEVARRLHATLHGDPQRPEGRSRGSEVERGGEAERGGEGEGGGEAASPGGEDR